MQRSRWTLVAAVLCGGVSLPQVAAAGSDDMLMPIGVGALGDRQLRASMISFGLGPREDRLHLLFHGRAMLHPRLSAGMGGVKGGYAFVERTHVHFGVEFGVAAGSGRQRGRPMGALATVEPGVFLRLLSDKAGAFHIDAGWFQPLVIRPNGLGGAAMLSLGWSPFYGR